MLLFFVLCESPGEGSWTFFLSVCNGCFPFKAPAMPFVSFWKAVFDVGVFCVKFVTSGSVEVFWSFSGLLALEWVAFFVEFRAALFTNVLSIALVAVVFPNEVEFDSGLDDAWSVLAVPFFLLKTCPIVLSTGFAVPFPTTSCFAKFFTETSLEIMSVMLWILCLEDASSSFIVFPTKLFLRVGFCATTMYKHPTRNSLLPISSFFATRPNLLLVSWHMNQPGWLKSS